MPVPPPAGSWARAKGASIVKGSGALRRLVVLGMLAGAAMVVGRKLGIIGGGNEEPEYEGGDFASTYEDDQQAPDE